MSKEPILDEIMTIPACKQALESTVNEVLNRRKVSPGLARDVAIDADNPFRCLSDGAVRRIEKALRELPGLGDSDKRDDMRCLTAARRVMAFRQLKSLD